MPYSKKKRKSMWSRLCELFIILCGCLLIISILFEPPAWSTGDMETLRLFYKDEELVYTPSRSAKSIIQVAENVTVITAEKIEKLKAHTLGDVLNTITGIQIYKTGGHGSADDMAIQGSQTHHVLLMIDGMRVNTLLNNYAFTGIMPVQNIERIEIIKGPASSSWGSALGGIVNVITKSFPSVEAPETSLSVSYGGKQKLDERVNDLQMELSGRKHSFGYYFLAGNLHSGDLSQNTQSSSDNLFGKMRLDFAEKARFALSLGYSEGKRGLGEVPGILLTYNDWKNSFLNVTGDISLAKKASLTFSYNALSEYITIDTELLSGPRMLIIEEDMTHSGSLHFHYDGYIHKVICGLDFASSRLEVNFLPNKEEEFEKKSVFANYTLGLERFSLTPGIRYDHTTLADDFWSPSLGLTFNFSHKTLLRLFGAKGFHLQSLDCIYGFSSPFINITPNLDLEKEKVYSMQIGIESTVFKYLWLKATLFRHNIWDARKKTQDPDNPAFDLYINEDEQRREGIELEMQTVSLFNTTLSAGYIFVRSWDLDNDRERKNNNPIELFDFSDSDNKNKTDDIPVHTLDVSVTYDDPRLLTLSLRGHYIWWRYSEPDRGEYDDIIWHVLLSKKIINNGKRFTEVFLSGHNIFDGTQYKREKYNKIERWVEAGIKFRF
ncbi:MAG: TonB-dependent receptor plug domain-containing protein [bacterium]